MRSSVEMSGERDAKFVIRYEESLLSIPRKTKPRYTKDKDNNQNSLIRQYVSSEADVRLETSMMESHQELSLKAVNSERPRKKTSIHPNRLIGSLVDIIPERAGSVAQIREDKQLPKISIEYNDQRLNGCLADIMRLKVVYRGYAPKNTLFFFKSLAIKPLDQVSIKRGGDYDLQFNSRFQSGNLSAAARKSHHQYWLFMREDTNTYGLRQWFYFSVINRKPGKYKFRICKYSKFYSLYREGMKPFIRTNTEPEWKQGGDNVKYEGDKNMKGNYLEFQYVFQQAGMKVQFATQPPYTYSMLKEYLRDLVDSYRDVKVRKLGQSLAGLEIPLITISESTKTQNKSAIIIMSRTHPSEVASNYALEGFLQQLHKTPELKAIFDFYIVPMVNPDGVFFGNHRTGVLGQDLNRNFHSTEEELFPQVACVQKIIETVKSNQKIAYLFDLHGHSARRNIFVYGDEHPIGSHRFASAHILPKILSQQISSFKYDYCVFKQVREKKNTARVYLSRKYKIKALTFQQSYGLLDQGPISTRHWKNFGIALAQSLLEYHKIYSNGKQEALVAYLSEQIKQQEEAYQKKLDKKLQKMQIGFGATQSVVYSTNLKKDGLGADTQEQVSNRRRVKTKTYERKLPKGITEASDEGSINQQELSSGDQDLQNTEEGLQLLRKEILKIGCMKEGIKRQAYNIPEKKLQIKGCYQPIIHQQRTSMVSRILKFQMKRKDQSLYFNKYLRKQSERPKKTSLSITERSERQGLELPSLRR